MTDVSKRELAAKSFFAGALLLLCALTFYYFAVLKIDYGKTTLLNLGPYPDATEYFAQAKTLLKDGWPSIQIGYDKLPSRYPFGYPALMLPWLNVLPTADAVLAPFRTNQSLGLLLLLAVFGFYAYLAMPLTGGFAALLLATLPGFFIFCRSSISEISASALVVFAFMFAYLGLKEERRWKIYVSAAFLGLSLNIRMQSLFFAPLLLVMAFFPERGTRLRWLLHCAALPILFLLAASPGLALNIIEFHSPFKTGYDFWVPWTPKWSEHRFSLRYLPNNVARLWSEFALRRSGFSAANIFGTGTCFVPAFVLLTCVGLLFIRKGRFTFCALLSGLSFLAAALVYSVADIRLYLPLLLLLIAVAALPVTWAAENLFTGKRIIVVLVVFALFSGACVGYPSRSGYNTSGIDRSQAWDALQFTTPPAESTWFIAQRRFLDVFGRQPGIVLSDIDPVYLNAFFPDWIVAAPLDWKHRYRFSRIWHYGPAEALALVNRGLQQSHTVYALFVSKLEMEEKMMRLPQLDGYEWVLAEGPTTEAAVLQLTPSS
ncbi:MAG TPA: hypothetical protein VF878_04150 [Candidatus Udaeobacter sp.]